MVVDKRKEGMKLSNEKREQQERNVEKCFACSDKSTMRLLENSMHFIVAYVYTFAFVCMHAYLRINRDSTYVDKRTKELM